MHSSAAFMEAISDHEEWCTTALHQGYIMHPLHRTKAQLS
jgi:hypothetical protein